MVPGEDGLERRSWFLRCRLSIPPPFSCYRADVPSERVPQVFLKSMEIKRFTHPAPDITSRRSPLPVEEGLQGRCPHSASRTPPGMMGKDLPCSPHRFDTKPSIYSAFRLENTCWQDALPAKHSVTCSAYPWNSNVCGRGALAGCTISSEHFKYKGVTTSTHHI